MKNRTPIISAAEHARVQAVIESARRFSSAPERDLAALENELRRARVVSHDEVPTNVVRMNSAVRVRDLDWNETEIFTLVYPHEADIARNRISVLAPVGAALLGCRAGDLIEWPVKDGVRRLRVNEVLSQSTAESASSVAFA